MRIRVREFIDKAQCFIIALSLFLIFDDLLIRANLPELHKLFSFYKNNFIRTYVEARNLKLLHGHFPGESLDQKKHLGHIQG